MTIGFVLDSDIDHPGGVQRFVKGLYKFVTQQGHHAVIFTGGAKGESEQLGFKVCRLGRVKNLPGNDAEISVFADWVEEADIKFLLKDEGVDLLHIQGVFGLLGIRFLDVGQLPSVGTFHNFWEPERLPQVFRLSFPIFGHYVGKMKIKIADSTAARELMQRIAPGDYYIIPPGINVERFRLARGKRFFPKSWVQIVYVGRLDKRKGLMHLLRAFLKVKSEVDEAGLLVVGKGSLRDEAEEFVRRNHLEDVCFTGYVPDDELPSYYRGSDIFCSPAVHGECFGIVLVEAMAANLPIVAFDNAGYRDVLTGEGRRFLVESGNVDRLALALIQLCRDSDLRRRMSEWGRREVEQYDWNVVGQKYLEIYKRLITEGKE